MTPQQLSKEEVDAIEEYVLRHIESAQDLDVANLIFTLRQCEQRLADSEKVARDDAFTKIRDTFIPFIPQLHGEMAKMYPSLKKTITVDDWDNATTIENVPRLIASLTCKLTDSQAEVNVAHDVITEKGMEVSSLTRERDEAYLEIFKIAYPEEADNESCPICGEMYVDNKHPEPSDCIVLKCQPKE